MKRLLLPLAGLALAACTSVRAHEDHEPGLDLADYATFALAAPPREAPPGLPSYSEIRGREINATIAADLAAKGYVEVPEDEAELLVSFSLVGETRQDVRSESALWLGSGPYHGWYGSGWYRPAAYTVEYVRGTLLLDAFDRAAQRVVWHGWSTVSLYAGEALGSDVLEAVLALVPARSAP